MACGGVFVLLVAVKLLLPDRLAQVNGRLTGMLEQNMDVRAVFSAVGRAVSGEADVDVALQDVYQAVFRPQELSPAVEAAAAPAGEEVDLLPPDVMAPLRSFRSGTGTSDGWLLPPSPEQENGTGEEKEAAAEDPAQTDAADDPEASTLAYVLYSAENLPEDVCLEQSVLGFDYCTPVMGTLTSGFGYREHPVEGEDRFHYGLDIGAAAGTEIGCFAAGTVSAVGGEQQLRKICHGVPSGGILHPVCPLLQDPGLLRGCRGGGGGGEPIAEVGETGMATGPHLHFELHKGSEYLNPIYYVSLA